MKLLAEVIYNAGPEYTVEQIGPAYTQGAVNTSNTWIWCSVRCYSIILLRIYYIDGLLLYS